ncbi:MAG: hypothetical protein M3Q15_00900 [Pseudomonadota bacterium]|nr:hypothetical protein [Pseudomonadota bacterium]
MKPFHLKIALAVAALGAAAAATVWAAAPEQSRPEGARNTPPGWSYEVKDGKRVPRVPRTVQADGSWVEEYKAGNCTVTRTGRQGEVRETRKCD